MTSQPAISNKTEPEVIYRNPFYNGLDQYVIETPEEDKLKNPWVNFYLKVGTFLNLTPNEFMDTPYLFLKQVSQEIDERLKNPTKPGQFFSWRTTEFVVAICQVFGGKSD